MRSILTYVRREPVRIYLYGLAVAIGGTLVALGHVSPADIEVWVYLLAVVLGVEGTRAKVTPTAAPRDGEGRALTPEVGD